jgi:hypothetical protein
MMGISISKKPTYAALATNRLGLTRTLGRKFYSAKEAATAARREFGRGWAVQIVDSYGRVVSSFSIR